jgi:hypothetical protein
MHHSEYIHYINARVHCFDIPFVHVRMGVHGCAGKFGVSPQIRTCTSIRELDNWILMKGWVCVFGRVPGSFAVA